MSSGRRYSVMIFCLSPVKELYLTALDHYDPDEVFIFKPEGDDSISQSACEIYSSVSDTMGCNNKQEIGIDAADFKGILGRLIDIKRYLSEKYGDYLDLYINISSGTHEFAAAATFASMLPRNCIAFRVELDTGSLNKERIVEIVNEIGFTAEEPESITTVQNRDPDEDVVEYLGVIRNLRKVTRYPKARQIIDALKEQGGWTHCPDKKSGRGRTPIEKREEMYLKRHYEAPALENGWLERTTHDELVVSDKGDALISVYGMREEAVDMKCCCSIDRNIDETFESKEFSIQKHVGESTHINRMIEPDEFFVEENENVITFDSGEKTYRFRLSME